MRHSLRIFAIFAIVAAFVLFTTGCKKSTPAGSGANASSNAAPGVPINQFCPIHPDKQVTRSPYTTDFKGHTIAFCSEDDLAAWNKWSDEVKQQFVDKAMKVPAPEGGN